MDLSRKLLVPALNAFFLEKNSAWFEKNFVKLAKTKKPDFCLVLQKGQLIFLSALIQSLLSLGYERVQEVSFPGEFSQKGGLIDVFPVNARNAFKVEFFGNVIEEIRGFEIAIPDEEKVRKILKEKLKLQKLFSGLENLRINDCLVHLDHGAARFAGMGKLENQSQDYYILEYAGSDKLYVPLGLERKLSKYMGFSDPKISRLGSLTWQKTKKKVKEETEKFAKELLAIYSEREIALRPPYSRDWQIESAIEASFPFEETPDQQKALLAIRQDLAKTKPMDRLLCGDVGFGKTEVALRTMLMAVSAGYTAAMLCPTTILANQHFQNFKQRLEGSAVSVDVLTRLQSKKEQALAIERLKAGKTDIIVGSHRVLSQDVSKNLFGQAGGLLVIDDEQRFGVKQKEKLKELRSSLDILSLSATPIPRTLYLSLSSLREMSLIQTPPQGRQSIKTRILPWSEKIIRQAVNDELARNGQVYYLHNRISSIKKTRLFLQNILPKAKIGIIHGRMKENQILATMTKFQNKEIDLLVATTIIENGIDFPNVNTLIVDDASRLGLSQAYQIRGRVGRFSIPASAYFLYPKRLSALAKKRLTVLEQAQALGSGWQVAIKDLEIRGAGNILGKEQSGSINQVGLNLYCQMLSEMVARQK